MNEQSLAEQAYYRIQQDILSGRLLPGCRVSEQALAQRLGFGRTPVREAVRRLHGEGLVEQVPRHGTIVRGPDRRAIIEIYELREALESYAVVQASSRIQPEEITLLELLCQQMRELGREMKRTGRNRLEGETLQQHLTADMSFHLVLIHAARNRRLTKAVADNRIIAQIFASHIKSFDLAFIAHAYRFHRRILRAVKKQDAQAARRWMVTHIRAAMTEMLDHFDRHQEQQRAEIRDLPRDVLDQLARLAGPASVGNASR
jgi:DNA-binding GntR family transcriptional regulator